MNTQANPFPTHLQQVLNYLKQGHATLPPQPMAVPPAPTMPMGSVHGMLPMTAPKAGP
jgi:hypothetical protein